MVTNKLSEQELEVALLDLPGWEIRDNKLFREYTFKDFKMAFGFVAQLALISEELNHHAELWNVFNRLEVSLWTHDVSGISKRDFTWARAANKITSV